MLPFYPADHASTIADGANLRLRTVEGVERGQSLVEIFALKIGVIRISFGMFR